MNRVRNNRFAIFISKVKKYRRSRGSTSAASIPFSRTSNIDIESAPFSETLSFEAPSFCESTQAKVPSIIQSSSSKTVGSRCCRKARARSRKLHRSKNYQHRHVTLGESFKNFPVVRYHCLFDKAHPIVAYFSDATLYSIPEHGAGLCRAKYSTLYPCREPYVWSVEESNESSASSCF